MKLDLEKVDLIQKTLVHENIDGWLIVGRETAMNSEPILPVLGEIDFIIATALLITKDKVTAVVSSLDYEGYKKIEGIDEVHQYLTFEEGVETLLRSKSLSHLALNYCTVDACADGLSMGMYLMIERILKRIDFKGEIVSAYSLINKVRGIKTSPQREKIKEAAQLAQEIFDDLSTYIHTTTTSFDIFDFFQDEATKKGCTMSWTPSQCPGVFVGPKAPRGHGSPTCITVEKGHLINIDFGVKKNGYCSDLQRMYYILKDDETDAPEDIKTAFYAVRDAIKLAADHLKPGVTGCEVDTVARDYLTERGYPSFNHALGHQVGHDTHDGGTILAPRFARYDKKELIDTPIDEHNIFTLEPSFPTRCGVMAIEEMVVVTPMGAQFLIPPQEELKLIRLSS